MPEGTDHIADEEELYRRIPLKLPWHDLGLYKHPSPKAFRPRKGDVTGLSVLRAKFITPEEACVNDRGSRYYVAVLKAGDLREAGFELSPRPLDGSPGHAEITTLVYDTRRETDELQLRLAQKHCIRIEGPFPEEA